MNTLIKITHRDGMQVVSARELHAFLESKQDFSHWIKARIKKYGFEDGTDYCVFDNFSEHATGHSKLTEYALTMNTAKELAMVEGGDKGQQARRYFIDCEQQLKTIPALPMNYKESLSFQ